MGLLVTAPSGDSSSTAHAPHPPSLQDTLMLCTQQHTGASIAQLGWLSQALEQVPEHIAMVRSVVQRQRCTAANKHSGRTRVVLLTTGCTRACLALGILSHKRSGAEVESFMWDIDNFLVQAEGHHCG